MNSSMTREEKRLAYARVGQLRHRAKVQKEKEWLAANPHITSQKDQDKEERRKNYETIRMLADMNDDTGAQKKKKKSANAFAALMCDDEDEEVKDEVKDEPKQEPKQEKKKLIWADEDDE